MKELLYYFCMLIIGAVIAAILAYFTARFFFKFANWMDKKLEKKDDYFHLP